MNNVFYCRNCKKVFLRDNKIRWYCDDCESELIKTGFTEADWDSLSEKGKDDLCEIFFSEDYSTNNNENENNEEFYRSKSIFENSDKKIHKYTKVLFIVSVMISILLSIIAIIAICNSLMKYDSSTSILLIFVIVLLTLIIIFGKYFEGLLLCGFADMIEYQKEIYKKINKS